MGYTKETIEQLSKEKNFNTLFLGIKALYEKENSAGGLFTSLKITSEKLKKNIDVAWHSFGLHSSDEKAARIAREELKEALINLALLKEIIQKLSHEKVKTK